MNEQMWSTMKEEANRARDLADEIAARYDVDDPQHPWTPQMFRDWKDFVDHVARPLVEADGDKEAEQAAMKLFRTVNPYYLCVCMVMMDNRITLPERFA